MSPESGKQNSAGGTQPASQTHAARVSKANRIILALLDVEKAVQVSLSEKKGVVVGQGSGGEAAICDNCLIIDGKNGMKSGRDRK